MLYNIESVIKRLQDAEKGLVTDKELLRLATPQINQIGQIIELLQKTVRAGYVDAYSVSDAAKYTGITRQTLYRWLDEGIIEPDSAGKVKINEMLKVLKMIEKRQSDKE
jgi:DNA invertase Pin-like site-specific DNA recombinase